MGHLLSLYGNYRASLLHEHYIDEHYIRFGRDRQKRENKVAVLKAAEDWGAIATQNLPVRRHTRADNTIELVFQCFERFAFVAREF